MSNQYSESIITYLKSKSNNDNLRGMAKFGIHTKNAIGIGVTDLRKIAKEIGINHPAAIDLWKCGLHEARILATMIADPLMVSKSFINKWVKDIDSWDLCDQSCNNLFRKTPFAIELSIKWPENDKLFVKRAGFVLMAVLSVHSKKMSDMEFKKYFPIIIKHSDDERNFVKKGVNWALRQIGKRNLFLHTEALKICQILMNKNSKSASWIGRDALNELTSERVLKSDTS